MARILPLTCPDLPGRRWPFPHTLRSPPHPKDPRLAGCTMNQSVGTVALVGRRSTFIGGQGRHMARPFTIRTATRATCRCAIRYFGQDYLGTGTLWDLSRTGGRVSGSSAAAVGTTLILHIQLPEELGPDWFWIDRAIVRWSTGTTFGIEIESVADGDRDFLAYALGEFEGS